MEFMTTKEAVQKWNISERRIRQLLQDGRIEGAVKVGNNWNIPINSNKPADKRSVKLDNTEFKFDLPDNYFDKVDKLNKELNSKRPISKETLKSLKESINLEWTYNSNGIEGNTLTLRETQVVLEGITVGGKSLKEHLEAINHEQAILFLDDLIKDKEPPKDFKLSLGGLSTAYQSLGYKANGYYITPSTLNNTIEGKQTLKDFMSYLKTKLSNDNNYTYIIVSELCTPDDDCRYYALKVKVGDNNG